MADNPTNKQSVAEKAREMLTARRSELQERQQETERILASIREEASEIEAMLNPVQPQAPAPAASASAPAQRATRASQNGSGPTGRAKAFLDSVQKNPGQPVTFHAAKMGLKQPNYLYRIRGQLEEQGLLRREGDGLVAVG
jgi:hypothetical protein